MKEGKAPSARVQLALAQNALYAGHSADAAKLFENALQQQPNDVMVVLQAAIALLHAGDADSAEPLVAEVIKASQGASAEQERRMAYCLHAQALLRLVEGRQFDEAEASCVRTRELIGDATEEDLSLRAASCNNEAVLRLVAGKYSGAFNRFEEARDNWTRAFGSIHPLVAADLTNQAALHVVLGEYAKAGETLACAEGTYRECLPKDHLLAAHAQTCRALLQEARGQYADGLATANEARATLEKTLGATIRPLCPCSTYRQCCAPIRPSTARRNRFAREQSS